MKKVIVLLFLLLLSQKEANAETIEGKSQSNVSVETNVEGRGQVRTRIEVEVNGNKKVVESDKPGRIEVKASNGTIDVKEDNSITNILPSEEPSAVASESPTPQVKEKKEEKKQNSSFFLFLTNIFDNLKKFLRLN